MNTLLFKNCPIVSFTFMISWTVLFETKDVTAVPFHILLNRNKKTVFRMFLIR